MENQNIVVKLPETVNPNLLLPDPSILQIYKDRQNRILWMLNEVGEESFDWVDFILDVNREDKDIPIDQRQPIKIYVANYGGSLEDAKMLVEIISLSQTPIYGICIGMCASAASMIFLSCHKKFATKNATFIFHKGSCDNIGGSYIEVMQFMDSYQKDVEAMSEFYKTHTKYKPEEIDKKLSEGDWYIYCTEALEKGIIDEVITNINILL